MHPFYDTVVLDYCSLSLRLFYLEKFNKFRNFFSKPKCFLLVPLVAKKNTIMFHSFQLWTLPGSYKTMKSSVSGIQSVSEVNSEGSSTISNAISIDPDSQISTSTVEASVIKPANTMGIVGASAGTDDFSVPEIKETFFSMSVSTYL
ncbi:hypothetical protein BJP37_00425 [Moorena bouillonii PNG]|uniref:Uncharacterized protein n=2 Tax=Coleofasciculaceae TaxID=1892251 RepID=A0A1U7MVP5_9CYAN|nr:hypothetical protein BJP37_00425 [Moorena bouillonii PNG]